MNNYKLTIRYDGTSYAGWQIQNNARTIQDEISKSIEKILQDKINLIGSGRTDTGVHAYGQVANFTINKELSVDDFRYSLNAVLPKDISVVNVERVFDNFHSRFDAKKRTYFYLFTNEKSPFYYPYSYFYKPVFDFDFGLLNENSRVFLGTQDFSSFCKKKSDVENKICTVFDIRWRKGKEFIYFKISADRFLHGMVRTIIGTILFSMKNNFDSSYIIEVIKKADREVAGESVPAKGLFLYKVEY